MTNNPKDSKDKPKPRKIAKVAKVAKVETFIQYVTMFKLESRSRPRMGADLKPRRLQCVSCRGLLEWRIYTLAPEKFDSTCPLCHMTALKFWAGKSSKELNANGKTPGVT